MKNVNFQSDNCLNFVQCLKPVSERKIKRELLVLSHVSDLPNMARLVGICWDKDSLSGDNPSSMPAIILKHAGRQSHWLCHGSGHSNLTNNKQIETSSFPSTYFLSEYEIKYFIFELLYALDKLHSQGIMHRDVKPRNVLINRGLNLNHVNIRYAQKNSSMHLEYSLPTTELIRRAIQILLQKLNFTGLNIYDTESTLKDSAQDGRSLMLIDFGLAEFYLPGQRYNVRVASRHYKAPELLLGYELYDYSMDLWSVGCILAGLLLRREPMFRG